MYADHDEAAAIIDHIRKRRKEIVHRSISFPDSEGLVYQSKSISENLIKKYIGLFQNHFLTKAEIRSFLDLPRKKRNTYAWYPAAG